MSFKIQAWPLGITFFFLLLFFLLLPLSFLSNFQTFSLSFGCPNRVVYGGGWVVFGFIYFGLASFSQAQLMHVIQTFYQATYLCTFEETFSLLLALLWPALQSPREASLGFFKKPSLFATRWLPFSKFGLVNNCGLSFDFLNY